MDTVKNDSQLYPYRRHLKTCEFFGPGGREARADKCKCPFHVDGPHHGLRVRESLRTRSRQIAERRLTELMRKLDANVASQQGGEAAPESALTPTRVASPQRTLADAALLRLQDLQNRRGGS